MPLQGTCPNCSTKNFTYFGDILTVAGARDETTIPCKECKLQLQFKANDRMVCCFPCIYHICSSVYDLCRSPVTPCASSTFRVFCSACVCRHTTKSGPVSKRADGRTRIGCYPLAVFCQVLAYGSLTCTCFRPAAGGPAEEGRRREGQG